MKTYIGAVGLLMLFSSNVFALENLDYCIPEGPRVALTFDDGPWKRHTEHILDVLHRYNARATFFVVGQRAMADPNVLRMIWDQGHELGVHTHTHTKLSSLSATDQQWEIQEGWNSIKYTLPDAHVAWWRAPYGDVPASSVHASHHLNLYHQGWSVDTNDWRRPTDEEFLSNLDKIKDGSVVLMHDHTIATQNNIEYMVSVLTDWGFHLVTLSELKAPVCANNFYVLPENVPQEQDTFIPLSMID